MGTTEYSIIPKIRIAPPTETTTLNPYSPRVRMDSGEAPVEQTIQDNILEYARQCIVSTTPDVNIDLSRNEPSVEQLGQVLSNLIGDLDQLKSRVEQYANHTERLRALTIPATDPRRRLEQVRTIKRAYDALSSSQPKLPKPTSQLTNLLAIKHLNETITDSKTALETATDQLASANLYARTTTLNLSDARLLLQTVKARNMRLETTKQERTLASADERARELLASKQRQQSQVHASIQALTRSLEQFSRDQIIPMLATEELDGSAVGELSHVNNDMLMGAPSAQAKSKQPKRQRRIDEIWGEPATADEPRSECEIVFQEWTELITELYEAWRGNRESGFYVRLGRDSAASRFLVRARVAQYHPKDARNLRLVDFARQAQE